MVEINVFNVQNKEKHENKNMAKKCYVSEKKRTDRSKKNLLVMR